MIITNMVVNMRALNTPFSFVIVLRMSKQNAIRMTVQSDGSKTADHSINDKEHYCDFSCKYNEQKRELREEQCLRGTRYSITAMVPCRADMVSTKADIVAAVSTTSGGFQGFPSKFQCSRLWLMRVYD